MHMTELTNIAVIFPRERTCLKRNRHTNNSSSNGKSLFNLDFAISVSGNCWFLGCRCHVTGNHEYGIPRIYTECNVSLYEY